MSPSYAPNDWRFTICECPSEGVAERVYAVEVGASWPFPDGRPEREPRVVTYPRVSEVCGHRAAGAARLLWLVNHGWGDWLPVVLNVALVEGEEHDADQAE